MCFTLGVTGRFKDLMNNILPIKDTLTLGFLLLEEHATRHTLHLYQNLHA